MHYWFLCLAILAEVVGTLALKASDGFTKILPSAVVFVGYALSFYLLSLVLRVLPIGITYSIWAGLGILLVTLAGALFYRQIPDWPAILGMSLIIVGVMVLFLMSKTHHSV